MRAYLAVVAVLLVGLGCRDRTSPRTQSADRNKSAQSTAAVPLAARAPRKPPADRIHHHYPLVVDLTNAEDLDLSADGERIVAGGEQGGVVVVERTRRKLVRRIATKRVASVAITADGSRVAYTTDDGASLVEVATGKQLATHAADGTLGRCGDGWLIARDKAADLVDATFKDVATLTVGEKLGIHGTVACGRGRAVLVAQHALFVFDLASKKQITRIDVPTDGDVNGLVDVVVGEKYIATMSNVGSVWLFDASNKQIAYAPVVAGQAQRLAVTADESMLVAGNVIFSLPDLAIRARLQHGGPAAFTPDGAWLVVSRNNDLDVLDVAALDTDPVAGHVDTGDSLAIDPTQRYLASGSGGRVFLWDLAKATPGVGPGPLIGVLDGHAIGTFDAISVAFLPDGKRLVTGGDATIVVWDLATLEPLARWSVQTDDFIEGEITVHADAHHIVASGSNHVYVYDATTYKQLSRLGTFKVEVSDGSVSNIALHPDGTHVAVASQGNKLGVYDRLTGARVAEQNAPTEAAESIATFAPDGTLLVELASTYARTLTWPGLSVASTFAAPWPSDVAWSQDGKQLAIGSWMSSSVSVFERVGQSLHKKWEQQTPWHTAAVAWDSKRGQIYSTGGDESIHVWNAATGAQIATWSGGGGDRIESLALSGDTLVVYADTGELRIFDLSKLEQVARFPYVSIVPYTEPRLVGDHLYLWVHRGELLRFVRDGSTWKQQPSWKPPDDSIWTGLGISRDGSRAWSINAETVQLITLDPASLRIISTQRALGLGGSQWRIDPTGTYLAANTIDEDNNYSRIDVWSLAPARRVRSLRNDASVQSYELAGKDEIMYYDVETPMRWSITTGKKRKDCTGRFGNVLGFQADHSRVILREGASLRVRSVSDCQEQVFYADGDETVATVDDKRLVVAAGGRITVWDLAKHEPVAILHALRDGLWSARTASHYTPPTHLAMPPSSTPATE